MTDAHAALADYDRVSALGVQVTPYRLAEALRETLVALADRDARIEAAKEWRGWYASGECPSPSEWKELDRRLSAPAVPVPQDNPEATEHMPKIRPTDLSFRCPGCGWSTFNREVEQHICTHPTVPSPDVRPKNGEKP